MNTLWGLESESVYEKLGHESVNVKGFTSPRL